MRPNKDLLLNILILKKPYRYDWKYPPKDIQIESQAYIKDQIGKILLL